MVIRPATCLLLVLAVLMAAPAVSAQPDAEVTVEASLDRDTIGMDEQATLVVVLSGRDQNLPAPKLPTLPMFEVYSQGHSTNISIVNGAVTASHTYRFMLLPHKAGTFPINQIAVVNKNRRYKADPLELTVLKEGTPVSPRLEGQAADSEGKSKDYFLEAVVDKTNPYVNEQVTLTLKFYIAVQYYGSPELTEPSTTGFWTELVGNKSPYFQKINGRNYKVIERKYALFPTQTGELTIGRAMIRTTVADRSGRYRDPTDLFGDFFGRGVEISVRSQPVAIVARPLPEKGRPANFTGTIGKFRIKAIADKTSVEVNQPISLAITISGTGNIKSVAEPEIPDLPDFRVYRASSSEKVSKMNDKIGGSKTYEEVFIPNRPGQLEIPALAFNFFDPDLGKYRNLTTRAIKVDVIKPEGYVASPDVPYGAPDLTIGSHARDIRFIKQELGKTSPVGQLLIVSPLYLLVNGLPVLLLAGTIVVRRHRQRLSGNIAYARSRGASRQAKRRLAAARKLADKATVTEFYAEISQALTSYIADKLNISPHGLTMDSIESMLKEKSADATFIADVRGILQQCDYARFAPSSLTNDDISDSLEKAEQVMTMMEGIRFA